MALVDVRVGNYVRLKKSGLPLPKLLLGSLQRIVDHRNVNGTDEVRIERRHRHRIVQCWIPTSYVDCIIPETEAIPADACILYGARTPGSAADARNRSWCLVCSEKNQCSAYQSYLGVAS